MLTLRSSRVAQLVILASALTCTEATSPDELSGGRNPLKLISDGANAGNAHFYFLPPLVAQPATSGTFDATLAPVVEVCEWEGSTGCGIVAATFSTTSGTAGNIVGVEPGSQLYHVNWDTKTCVTGPCTLDPGKTYRLRVLVAGVQLGFADVDVVANGSALKNVQTNDYIGLVNGRTMPVKFRIEDGAIEVLPNTGGSAPILPAEGGILATSDGAVAVEIPAGALPPGATPTSISVAPVETSTLPVAENIAPGTTFHFGPDGTQFSAPVTVRIAYDPSTLPPGIIESHLRLFTVVNGAWQLVPSSRVDMAARVIVGEVTHFSEYGGGSAKPVAKICAFPLWENGYSGTIEGCDSDSSPTPQVVIGTELLLGIMWRDETHFAGGSDGSTIFEPRELIAVSSDPAVLRVDSLWSPDGQPDWWPALSVTALAPGQVTLYLTSESVTTTMLVTVLAQAPVQSVNVDNAALITPLALGEDRSITATVMGFGQVLTDRPVTWQTDNPAVASVNASGVVRAVAGGCTSLWAASEGVESNRVRVTVTPAAPGLAFISQIMSHQARAGADPWVPNVSKFQLHVMGADGCDPRPLNVDASLEQNYPEWSPDGTKLAFSTTDGPSGWIEIVNADGSNHRRLTTNAISAHKPRWSHDGTRLAFMGQMPSGGHRRVFVINEDGTSEIALGDVNQPYGFGHPSWSPDDSKIVFDASGQVMLVNSDGTGAVVIALGSLPQWSPTGARIAYLQQNANLNLGTINPDGSDPVTVVGNRVEQFQWSPSGDRFALTVSTPGSLALEVVNVDGSGRTRLTEGLNSSDFRWTRDGQGIYYQRPLSNSLWNVDRAEVNAPGAITPIVRTTTPTAMLSPRP